MSLDQMMHDLRQHYLFLRRIEQELEFTNEVLARLHEAQESAVSLLDVVADLRDDVLGASERAHKKALARLLVNLVTRH